MSRDPVRDAFVPLAGGQAIDDMSEAIEQYRPLVVFATTDITTRDLSRTKSIALISGAAIRFYKQDQSNTDAEDGETVILDSVDNPFVLVQRGDRYDLSFGSTGLIGDDEEFPAFALPTPITIPADMPGSLAVASQDAATAETIFTIEKSTDNGATWSDVATATFAAGQRTATYALASDASLAAGTLIRPHGPASADATLAGLSLTIVCTR